MKSNTLENISVDRFSFSEDKNLTLFFYKNEKEVGKGHIINFSYNGIAVEVNEAESVNFEENSIVEILMNYYEFPVYSGSARIVHKRNNTFGIELILAGYYLSDHQFSDFIKNLSKKEKITSRQNFFSIGKNLPVQEPEKRERLSKELYDRKFSFFKVSKPKTRTTSSEKHFGFLVEEINTAPQYFFERKKNRLKLIIPLLLKKNSLYSINKKLASFIFKNKLLITNLHSWNFNYFTEFQFETTENSKSFFDFFNKRKKDLVSCYKNSPDFYLTDIPIILAGKYIYCWFSFSINSPQQLDMIPLLSWNLLKTIQDDFEKSCQKPLKLSQGNPREKKPINSFYQTGNHFDFDSSVTVRLPLDLLKKEFPMDFKAFENILKEIPENLTQSNFLSDARSILSPMYNALGFDFIIRNERAKIHFSTDSSSKEFVLNFNFKHFSIPALNIEDFNDYHQDYQIIMGAFTKSRDYRDFSQISFNILSLSWLSEIIQLIN